LGGTSAEKWTFARGIDKKKYIFLQTQMGNLGMKLQKRWCCPFWQKEK
jgi:hypothetical protein